MKFYEDFRDMSGLWLSGASEVEAGGEGPEKETGGCGDMGGLCLSGASEVEAGDGGPEKEAGGCGEARTGRQGGVSAPAHRQPDTRARGGAQLILPLQCAAIWQVPRSQTRHSCLFSALLFMSPNLLMKQMMNHA